MRKLVAVVIVAACGSSKPSAPSIECEIQDGPSLVCQVRHPDTDHKYNVCWTYSATCKNGATFVSQDTCAKVIAPMVTEAKFSEPKYMKISGPCDVKVSTALTNVTATQVPYE